ncbi:MAG: site-specific integrase [Actinobacteria bacterium]|jgi:integrase|nr:site-specific integrase [Actinomycetota bacterium]
MRLRAKPDIWELRLYLGRDEKGKVKHKHVTFVGTKRAAERELARLAMEFESNPQQRNEDAMRWGDKTTFNDAIMAWKENGWQDLSPKTVRDYEGFYRRHIRDSIGRKRISSTGVFEVEAYFRSLADGGLGLSGVKHVRGILHKAARLAGKWSGGSIPNPLALADLPKPLLQTEAVRAPTLEEVKTILECAESGSDVRVAAMIRVMATTGMRRGEAAALRWSDILFDRNQMVVDEAIITAKGSLLVKSPKTRASIRTVAVDSETINALAAFQQDQASFAQTCGLSLDDDGFVFSYSPDGLVPPHPDSISHAFKKIVKQAGVASDIHLHSLRHFQATVIDPIVSERQKQARLGWSTSHMARHYTDPISDEDRKVADEVGRLLNS